MEIHKAKEQKVGHKSPVGLGLLQQKARKSIYISAPGGSKLSMIPAWSEKHTYINLKVGLYLILVQFKNRKKGWRSESAPPLLFLSSKARPLAIHPPQLDKHA